MLRDALNVRRIALRGRNVTPRDGPSARGGAWAGALGAGFRRDLGFAIRRLRRAPMLSLGVGCALALGIGANTTIYVVGDTFLRRPLPYANDDRLFMVWEEGPQPSSARTPVSVPDFLDWRASPDGFEDLAAFADRDFNVTMGDRVERLRGQVVSSNYFDLLGFGPERGIAFEPENDLVGGERIAVLSHGLWRREWGGDPGVVGRTLSIDDVPFTVAGIMPEDFRPPGAPSIWLPLSVLDGNLRIWRATHVLNVVGRLRPAVDPIEVEARLTRRAQDLWERAPLWSGWTIRVNTLRAEVFGDFARASAFLWAAGLAVMVVMIANLANLFLAESISRSGELAVRRVLGAPDLVLVSQRSIEIGLPALGATIAGLVLASTTLRWLSARLPGGLTALAPLEVDATAIVYAALLAGIVTVTLAVLSTGRVMVRSLAPGVRSSSGAGDRPPGGLLRSALVAGQVAISLAMLVTTLLLAGSYRSLRDTDPGFTTRDVMTFRIALAGPRYAEAADRRAVQALLLDRLAGHPGVESVGMGSHVPFVPAATDGGASVFVLGRVPEPGAQQPLADVNFVSAGFLPTLGVRLLEGRGLSVSDDAEAPPVALVNRTAAEMLWPDTNPIGDLVRTGATRDTEMRVVGLIDDVRAGDLRMPPRPRLFVPAARFPPMSLTFVVRSELLPDDLSGLVREVVASVDPALPIFEAAPLRHYVDRSMASSVLTARVLTALAALGVVLAVVGIYSVVTFTVGLRTRELGVRRALGARDRDVLRLVALESAAALGAGAAGGVVLALLAARLVSNQLFGVSPLDPPTYLVAGAFLGSLTLISALLPALRAARVQPSRALEGTAP
ncbi:MAG TPA: ABC transporter permease [Longimicrobiales bacterium]